MNRLSDNDKTWGPFIWSTWHKSISAVISSGDDEDPENYIRFTGFGRVLQIRIPTLLKRCGKYQESPTEYGFYLSAQSESYDFLQVYLGAQTDNSSTRKAWSMFLPWTQTTFVRHSIYSPDGTLFSEKLKGHVDFEIRDKCPTVSFEMEDFDGERIIATCRIEEREWSNGEKWCSWLKWFSPNFVRRVLDISFSAEVGKGKGSWKGGTMGHGIDMEKGETPESAFRRYCEKGHNYKGGESPLKFIATIPE